MGHPWWPLFDLRVRTSRLELRPPCDDDFPALLELVDAGIHDPAEMPFSHPWTDAEPEVRDRRAVQHWWRHRANWEPDDWDLPFLVSCDGRPVGIQDIFAKRFATLREFETGSWLGRAHQGRGIGTEMRAAILHFAFIGLGAEVAHSSAFVDNPKSLGVSRRLGYEDNGRRRDAPRDQARELIALRLPREKWECTERPDVTIEGLEPCLPMFGVG